MNKSWYRIVACFVLSAMITAGCSQNDQDPPPENNNGIENENQNENNDLNDNQNVPNDVNERENGLKDDDYNIEQERWEPAEDEGDVGNKVMPLG